MSAKKLKRDLFTDLPFDCLYECVCFMKSPKDFLSVLLTVKGFREFLIRHQRDIKNIRYVVFRRPELKTYPLAQNVSIREVNLRKWGSFEELEDILSKFTLLKTLDVRENQKISQDYVFARKFSFGMLDYLKELTVGLSSRTRVRQNSLEFLIDVPLLESLSIQNNNTEAIYCFLKINNFPKILKNLNLKRVFINVNSSENYLDDISVHLRNLYLIGTNFSSSNGFSHENFPRLRKLLLESVFSVNFQASSFDSEKIDREKSYDIFLRNLPNLEFLKIRLDLGILGMTWHNFSGNTVPFQFDGNDFRTSSQTWESLKILDLSLNIPISLLENLSYFKKLEVFKLKVSGIVCTRESTKDSKHIVIQNVENLRRLILSNFSLTSMITVNGCARLNKIRLFFFRILHMEEIERNQIFSFEDLLSLEKLHLSSNFENRENINLPDFKLVNVNLLKTLIVESGFDDEWCVILKRLKTIDTIELTGITREFNGDYNSKRFVDIKRMKSIIHDIRLDITLSPNNLEEKSQIKVLKIKEFNYHKHNPPKELPINDTACISCIFPTLEKIVVEWVVGNDCPLDETDFCWLKKDCVVELNVVRRISRKRKKIVHSLSFPFCWSDREEMMKKINKLSKHE